MNPQLVKSFPAATAVGGGLFAKFAAPAASLTVTAAAAAGDALLGVTDRLGAEAGGMLDVTLAGLAEIRLGGTVAAGDRLTANASGAAVKCAPAAGTTANYGAIALAPGVSGDVVPVHVERGAVTTPAG